MDKHFEIIGSEIIYTEKVIEKLNDIDWNNIGKNGQDKDMELGVDFIIG